MLLGYPQQCSTHVDVATFNQFNLQTFNLQAEMWPEQKCGAEFHQVSS